MKTLKTLVLVALIVSLGSPLVAEAAWWNPFSWFKKVVVLEQPRAIVPVPVDVQKQEDVKKPTSSNPQVVPQKKEVPYPTKVAQCLKDKGAQFFGASWCPHCQEQKVLFGSAAKLLPYVECSSDATISGQAQICIDNKIEAYPTWKFKNGETLVGEQTIETLAAKAQCAIIK
jgi:thiol-disulfide isomerase/thioredoxin